MEERFNKIFEKDLEYAKYITSELRNCKMNIVLSNIYLERIMMSFYLFGLMMISIAFLFKVLFMIGVMRVVLSFEKLFKKLFKQKQES